MKRLATAVTCVATAIVLTACGTRTATAPSDVGSVLVDGGKATIVVPALWAGSTSDGTPIGGVEPASITASTAGNTPEFRVNLADIEAQGAGQAWRAATSMAAVFATVYVGADPRDVDLDFTVTGPIDGPSAGGILTVGLIAAFQGASLAPGVTMTGTITADGSIGAVGSVPTKLEAAARAGYSTVVVPAALMTDDFNDGDDLTAIAEGLDIAIVPVRTIGEAYAAMTGLPIESPVLTEPISLSPRATTVARRSTQELLVTARQMLGRSSNSFIPEMTTWATEQLAQAEEAVTTEDFAAAYGIAAFVLTELTREEARNETTALVAREGFPSARAKVQQATQQTLQLSERAMSRARRTPIAGFSQCMALPAALGWASFAEVTSAGIQRKLDTTSEPRVLSEASQSIAESRLGLDVFLPDALEIVAALDSGGDENCDEYSAHLSGYSSFLVQAAHFGEDYLSTVLSSTLEDETSGLKFDYLQGALIAREQSDEIKPSVEPYASEAEQYSTALTYFWLTSYAITEEQAYEVSPAGPSATGDSALDAAVGQTWWFVDTRNELLGRQGVDTSAATWSSRWALEAAVSERSTSLAEQAGWLAQGELWYDAVQVSTSLSYLNPVTIK